MSNQKNLNKFYTALILSVFSFCLHASNPQMHDFETVRLKTMGGTGVGSILVEDTAFLNPAPIAFFNTSTIYAQKDSMRTSDTSNTNFPNHKSYGFVLAQAEPPLSGTFSYITQSEGVMNRKRFGVSLASPISQYSAMGISVRSSKDENTSTLKTIKYYQSVLGVTHAIDENTSIGLVFYDAFKSKGDETKVILGIQKSLFAYISGAFDICTDYTKDQLSKSLMIRGGLQVKLMDDFFIRVGGFNDRARQEKGEGYGIAWIQPKLSFEFGLKSTRSSNLNNEKTIKETSFSISLRGI